MRTAIVSDLHLGTSFGEDLLRDPEIRRVLFEEIAGADRLILLGDTVEMRERPLPEVLPEARPFFEELGETMAGRPVVLVPGNHDHRLAEEVIEAEALENRPLGLEQHGPPSGKVLSRIAGWLGGAELDLAYPGLWLRDDVYALHGHYMDCHMTLPRLECLAAAVMMRALGALPESTNPSDYERVLSPVYGLSFSVSQSGKAEKATRPSEKAWRALSSRNGSGRGRGRRSALAAIAAAGVPVAVWSLNRTLRSEFSPVLSPASISQSGVEAGIEMSRRMGIDAAHVITGHTHRAGPDEGAAEWQLHGGGRLHNTGSWVFASAFHPPGAPRGPYWPGTVTWVEDDGPPRRVRLLEGHSREELQATVDRQAPRDM